MIATDRDLGINGKVSYSIISGNEDGNFALDSLSGNLTTTSVLDYEEQANYQVNEYCLDGHFLLYSKRCIMIYITCFHELHMLFFHQKFR